MLNRTNKSSITSEFQQTSRSREKPPTPFSIRFTIEERQKLDEWTTGTSVSAYVRKRLFGGEESPRKSKLSVPAGDKQALSRVLGLLGQSRIANNLNQLAYHANCGSLLLDEQTQEEIQEVYAHVAAMRADLLKALGLDEAPQ